MSPGGPPRGANAAPSVGSAAAQPQAWGDPTSSAEYSPYDPSASDLPRGPERWFVLLLCAVVPFVMLAITYEVVARHFFDAIPLWVNDVTGYLLMAVTFLGGAFVMSREGHTRVDILVVHAGAGVQRTLTVVNAILVLLVSIVLACVAGYAVWDSFERKLSVVAVVEIPRYVVLSPIFVGCVLLCVERMLRIRALTQGPRPRRDAIG
jgi:TRAP-type C4-dicarboxylate transport system permease small subunit